MFDWIEWFLAVVAVIFLTCAWIPRLRAYRSLFLGGFVLMVSAILFRRRDDALEKAVSPAGVWTVGLPVEVFGIAWWVLGAWLVRSLLTLVLRRTMFPDDNQPHARRLFADLGTALVYVIAFVGIMETVLKQPLSAVLATSGVLAIVLGLALQNTLGDLLSGLSINIEKPFGAGDWITLNEHVEGQVIEINWRATRIKTYSNDLIIVPNSVIAKAIVTNHRRLYGPYLCLMKLKVENTISPAVVISMLQTAAAGAPGAVPSCPPVAHACEFVDTVIGYELYFGVEQFTSADDVRSQVASRIVDMCRVQGIHVGAAPLDVRFVTGSAGGPDGLAQSGPCVSPGVCIKSVAA
jgi:small-conductance mechanosensitive channel